MQDVLFHLYKGMNQSVDPIFLSDGYASRLINCNISSGRAATRPGFTFVSSLAGGKYQGSKREPYTYEDSSYNAYAINGFIYLRDIDTGVITLVGSMSGSASKVYFCQADRYLIVQDGVSTPLIIEGLTSRSASSVDNEVPIGTLMIYGHNRLYMVPAQVQGQDAYSRYFIAGDIMLPNDPATVLKFTETEYLNGGGAFALPHDFGPIGAMGFFKNQDTGTGYGPLVVIGEKGGSLFQINAPREQWQDIDISTVLFNDIGSDSPFAVFSINDDLFFRGIKHIRTVKQAASVARGAVGPTTSGISTEVYDEIEKDQDGTRSYVSSAYDGDHIYFTADGSVTSDGDIAFKELIAMNTYVTHSLSGEGKLVYDGLWTGFDFLGLLTATKRSDLMVIVKRDGQNELWKLDASADNDNGITSIECRVYTPLMLWKETYLNGKSLSHMDLWFSDIGTDIEVSVYYRPEGYPYWSLFDSGTMLRTLSGPDQLRSRIRLELPEEVDSDVVSDRILSVSEAFQFMIEWKGSAKLLKMTVVADEREFDWTVIGDAGNGEEVTAGVELDDYGYEV